MIAIIDYDAGNLKSVQKALASLGEESQATRDAGEILAADKITNQNNSEIPPHTSQNG